jgi:putative ABC transport system substrate-binding protein
MTISDIGRQACLRVASKLVVSSSVVFAEQSLGGNTPMAAALQPETRNTPIVFLAVSDPVFIGFVSSFAHPGGNMTGFMALDFPMAGKRLELRRTLAPAMRRVA